MKVNSAMDDSRRQAHHRTMKRQGSNTSSFNRQHRDTRCKTALNVLSEGEANLRHYLHKLGLPSGLHASIEEMYSAMESRIWLVDNSLDMNVRDCALLLADDDLTTIIKEEGHSRWTEQLQVVDFHMKMAARTWIPTKFWMTNAPQNEAQRYGVCWGEPKTWSSERDLAHQKILKTIKPERVSNPLGHEICKVIQKLKEAATWVKEEGKFVSVVICTQGVPTDKFGETSSEVMKEFIKSFKALSDLPVKIVFRLCTRDKKVMNFYKKIDMDIDCDVFGSYWDEAVEVYQHNSWLTYGIGLHRIREAGLGSDIMDYLDERPLSTSELYDWCRSMFVGDEDLLALRHPAKDWSGFITDIKELLRDEQMVWNPIKKKLCPWIDVARLETIYQPRRPRQQSTSFHQERHSSEARRHTETEVETMQHKSTSFQQGVKERPVHRRRVTVSYDEPASVTSTSESSWSSTSQKGSFKPRRRATVSEAERPSVYRKSTSFQDQYSKNVIRSTSSEYISQDSTNYRKAQSFHKKMPKKMPEKSESFHAGPRDPEPVSLDSSSSKPRVAKRQSSSFYDPMKSSTAIKQELQGTLFGVFDEQPNERSISTVIKKWSHEPNGKIRPLQMLLFEAPVLLPPNNPMVEHHEYFDKWKALDRDAFKDEEGKDAADEVIRKLARRCKMFLHPDKWPTDLNEDQKFLLQTLWDTLSESALF